MDLSQHYMAKLRVYASCRRSSKLKRGRKRRPRCDAGWDSWGLGGYLILCCAAGDQPNLSCMPLMWNDAQAQSIRIDSVSTNGVREAAVDAGGIVLKKIWTRGREDMTRYLRGCE